MNFWRTIFVYNNSAKNSVYCFSMRIFVAKIFDSKNLVHFWFQKNLWKEIEQNNLDHIIFGRKIFRKKLFDPIHFLR